MGQDLRMLLLFGVFIFVIIVIISFIFNLSPLSGNNGLIETCKFNESTEQYDVCFWRWDPASKGPSIYF